MLANNKRPVRRNGTAKPQQIMASETTSTSISNPSPSKFERSPFLPTPTEAYLLAIYPATLLLGSVFSLLEPNARNAPYSAYLQSHPPEQAPSYFARKKNLFNVFFVKIGWFWTTLAFFTFIFLHPSTGPSRGLVLTPKRVQAFLRYAFVTLWWVIMTQWFFGPALVDRSFRLTGGQCELLSTKEGQTGMSDARQYVTAGACKLAGGKWKGGHDISGHVFILVLASAFLWFEILPVMLRNAGLRENRRIRNIDGTVGTAAEEIRDTDHSNDATSEAKGGIGAPLGFLILSWWMLLMTAAYFHTWFEKVTGLIVAFTAVATVYFLPRGIPSMRTVLGMPGV